MPKSWLVRGAESAERARRRMQLLGVTPNGYPLWEPWENSPLEILGPAHSIIRPMLLRRTDPARYAKASRMGVALQRRTVTDEQARKLKRIYPTASKAELLDAFPGWTLRAIRSAANYRGYKRAPKRIEPTGILLLDQILARARKQNYDLRDLDALGGRRGYYTRRRWRTKPSHTVHFKTAYAMGGQVRARFHAKDMCPVEN